MTIRVPAELYQVSRQIARRRQISLNQLVQECLQELARAEEDRELYEAFSLVGRMDPQEAGAEFAWAAQREVVLASPD